MTLQHFIQSYFQDEHIEKAHPEALQSSSAPTGMFFLLYLFHVFIIEVMTIVLVTCTDTANAT